MNAVFEPEQPVSGFLGEELVARRGMERIDQYCRPLFAVPEAPGFPTVLD